MLRPEISDDADQLSLLRSQLLKHPLYDHVKTVESLRLFMREHVFAVWDFMSLLKRLQQIVTCCGVPWLPAADPSLARFINQIVIAEESDEDGQGGYASHFELYLAAMDEIGADSRPIRDFVSKLRQGETVEKALCATPILSNTRRFVAFTIALTQNGHPHQVAAAFFHGREDIIPDMFSRFVVSLPNQGVHVGRLAHYLNRHIELDGSDHGPLAQKLVQSLCHGKVELIRESERTACTAIEQRIALWDGILAEIS